MSEKKQKKEGKEEKLSPASVQKSLKGVDYPASRQELIDHAEDQGADQEVMRFLQNLPDEEFQSPVGVMKHFNEARNKAAG